MPTKPQVNILTEVDGFGQKVAAVSLAAAEHIVSGLTPADFKVEAFRRDQNGAVSEGTRTITNVAYDGEDVILQLDPTDANASTTYRDPDTRLSCRYQVSCNVTLKGRRTVYQSTGRVNLVVDDFQLMTHPMSTGAVMPYQLYVPHHYDPAKRYPVILFLHGAGERGADGYLPLEGNEGAVSWARSAEQAQRPCFVIAPQCPAEGRWTTTSTSSQKPFTPTPELDAAYEILKSVMTEYSIEETRVYVTGISMGGFGTWALGIAHPETFAALVPICGGGDPERAGTIADKPIWAFHHAGDPVVPVGMTRAIVRELETPENDLYYRPVLYTEYPVGDPLERGEHFSWVPAYQTEPMREWLFAQRLGTGVGKIRDISPHRQLPDPPFKDGKIPYGFAKTDHIERKFLDIRYTNRPDSAKLDVYLPATRQGPYPVMMYVHGGGFFFGSKEMDDLQPILYGLERGYAVVSVNYTLIDCPIGVEKPAQSVFPQALYQAKAALRWIRANAAVCKFDPDRVAVLGTSAGGQIAGLLGTTGHKPETGDLSLGNSRFSSAVQAAIIACGANRATPNHLRGVFSTRIEDHAAAGGPPLLLLHGTEDQVLPYQGSVDLAAKLRHVLGEAKVKLITLPDAGHNNDPAFFANVHVDTKKVIYDFADQALAVTTGCDLYGSK